MEIVIYDQLKADIFSAIFQHMKLFSEHITLECSESGVFMQCMDSAHVAIVELRLPAAWFNRYEYSATSGSSVRIGISSTILHRMLTSRDKGQQIQLVYSDSREDGDYLMVHLTCDDIDDLNMQSMCVEGGNDTATEKKTKPFFDKHFELPLIDIEETGLVIPEIEYSADMTMKSAQFANIVSQLKMFGDTMDVMCSEERIVLTSVSHEQGKMFVEIGVDDLTEFAIEEGAELNLSFSLTYLKSICSYSKISDNVRLQYSNAYPMQVAYYLDDSGSSDDDNDESKAFLSFHLAPKIND